MFEIIISMLVIGLAGSSIGYLIVNENGPFDVLSKIREYAGITQEVQQKLDEGDYQAYEDLGLFGKMFTCDTCSSTAFTIFFWLTYLIFPPIIHLWAAFSAVSVALIVKNNFNE